MFVFNHKPRIWECIYRTTFWVFFLKSIPLLSLTTGIAAWSKMEFLRYSVRRWIQYDRRIILLHIDSKYYFLCQWTPPSSCYGKFIRISPEIFRHTGGTPHTPYPPFSYPTVHSIPAPCPHTHYFPLHIDFSWGSIFDQKVCFPLTPSLVDSIILMTLIYQCRVRVVPYVTYNARVKISKF